MRIVDKTRVRCGSEVARTNNVAYYIATAAAVSILTSASLHGCCSDPEPQLGDWSPGYTDFTEKADWWDDKGIWRGNPTWKFGKELEVEDYKCKAVYPGRPICIVWTAHEWNCNEHDFGICKCYKIDDKDDYCQEWGCHALEADQEVCWVDLNDKDSEKEHCRHEEYPMNEYTYSQLVAAQDQGSLTTGERWWTFGSLFYNMAQGITLIDDWPPYEAYSPASRHTYRRMGDVCIVNGDNKALAKRHCYKWREIETEISVCHCLSGSRGACMRWTCEERDVGLFSILFRTRSNIEPYTEGSETEIYECKQLNADGDCIVWEGDISSREEVEWTRCECRNGACNTVDATWVCDEYEIPKTLVWTHPEYGHKWVWFLFAEIIGVCVFWNVCGEGAEDAIPVSVCISTCVGLIIFPFLMVTYGTYAFLALGLPFWVCRFCFCCAACVPTVCGAVKEQVDALKGDSPVKISSKDRLKRGASKIIGKKVQSNVQVAPAPTTVVPVEPSNEPTNETNEPTNEPQP